MTKLKSIILAAIFLMGIDGPSKLYTFVDITEEECPGSFGKPFCVIRVSSDFTDCIITRYTSSNGVDVEMHCKDK